MMFSIFFAAVYDLSAALTDLRVAIRLCDGGGRDEDCSCGPMQMNIISTAAMNTPLPSWITRRPADGSYVCFRRNRTHVPHQSEATRLTLHVPPPWSARVYRSAGAATASLGASTIVGRRIVKVEPRPGALSTVMSPPII